jgi:hypothetical protein
VLCSFQIREESKTDAGGGASRGVSQILYRFRRGSKILRDFRREGESKICIFSAN